MREVAPLREKRKERQLQRFTQEVADYFLTVDALTIDIDEPTTINEAWNDNHSMKWNPATDSEFAPLQSNDWDLVPMQKYNNIVGCH